ncbi:unnamed protein product [Linum trigynum]|uniref:F-box domain-containing protein n=1 Tax=Linum trigynum TaxID=586398 RepID=A0AAV2ES59_9ROSI
MARSFSDLPGDLLLEIMGKLEVDADHVRASSVCLSWLTAVETLCVSRALKGNQPLKTSLFHKPSQALGGALQQYSTSALRVHELLARRELYTFPTVHNQAQLGVKNFQLVGSSLGLLCVISGLRIYLYNPYFRWFRQVNHLQLRSRMLLLNLRNAGLGLLWEPDISVSVRASGFGFDLNSHQFKFMRVLEYLNSNYQVVEVYSIASGVVQSAPWSLFDPLLCNQRLATEYNGSLLWISEYHAPGLRGADHLSGFIVAFSLGNHVLSCWTLPEQLQRGFELNLGLLRSQLCLCARDASNIKLFLFNGTLWQPRCSIQHPNIINGPFVPLGIPIDGLILFQTGGKRFTFYFEAQQLLICCSNNNELGGHDPILWSSFFCGRSFVRRVPGLRGVFA